MEYDVRSITDIADETPAVSYFPNLAEEHRRFLRGWSRTVARDYRQRVSYVFGSTITEPDIARRWQEFEARYREQKRIDRFWMATIENGVVEPTRLCVMSNNTVVRETVRPIPDLGKVFPDVSDQDIRRAVKSPADKFSTNVNLGTNHVVEEGFLLGSGIFKNYYNWTMRYASRLRIFADLPRHLKLITPPLRKSHVGGSLAFHNIRRGRTVQVGQPVLVRKLHICSPSILGRHELSPQLVLGLGRHPLLKREEGVRGRKLFIPRVNVKIRRVLNEGSAIDALARQGFEAFDCAQHSVQEQALAFHSADVIVGVHGAGFANIAYARMGATVIEIIPEGFDAGVTSYRSLADHFKLKYVPLFAREVVAAANGNRCNSDVEIDVAELQRVVENIADPR